MVRVCVCVCVSEFGGAGGTIPPSIFSGSKLAAAPGAHSVCRQPPTSLYKVEGRLQQIDSIAPRPVPHSPTVIPRWPAAVAAAMPAGEEPYTTTSKSTADEAAVPHHSAAAAAAAARSCIGHED